MIFIFHLFFILFQAETSGKVALTMNLSFCFQIHKLSPIWKEFTDSVKIA